MKCFPKLWLRVFTIRFTATTDYCSWALNIITHPEQYSFIWIGVILEEQFTLQSIDLGMNGQAMPSTNSNRTIRDRAPSINGPDRSSQSAFDSASLLHSYPLNNMPSLVSWLVRNSFTPYLPLNAQYQSRLLSFTECTSFISVSRTRSRLHPFPWIAQ